VFDAFLWLFFGKNSEDKTDFEKKPLDKNNNFIKDLETEVEAIIETEGHEIAVKKYCGKNGLHQKQVHS
jgi:exonuclease SbcC